MPEGILDFFELVWAESQSLDIHVQAMQALRIVSLVTLQVSRKINYLCTCNDDTANPVIGKRGRMTMHFRGSGKASFLMM